MSAYGAILRTSSEALPSTTWPHINHEITIHHLTLSTAQPIPGLVDYLCSVFAKEVEDGFTYPQEDAVTIEAFKAYFFAADVFIAVVGSQSLDEISDWPASIAGFYYVKPNYPGRSSHICNAGFVVPPNHRGAGYGRVLADSYLHYAPKLGYQASVFNLVFVNNHASIKLWERLGFTKAGRIPNAGRMKKKNGEGEEYVDAWVFYKSFVDE